MNGIYNKRMILSNIYLYVFICKNIVFKYLLYIEKIDIKIIFGILYKVFYLKVYGK